jgi:hypothetical protein
VLHLRSAVSVLRPIRRGADLVDAQRSRAEPFASSDHPLSSASRRRRHLCRHRPYCDDRLLVSRETVALSAAATYSGLAMLGRRGGAASLGCLLYPRDSTGVSDSAASRRRQPVELCLDDVPSAALVVSVTTALPDSFDAAAAALVVAVERRIAGWLRCGEATTVDW